MATITLSELRTLCRELADMEAATASNHFVDDAELNRRINEACAELRDLLIELRAQQWFIAEHTIDLVVDQVTYTLPSDFYLLELVLASDGALATADEIVTVDPYEMTEEAGLRMWSVSSGASTVSHYRYRLIGDHIHILPVPQDATHDITLRYVPAYQEMASDLDTFTCPQGWWKWAALKVAIDLLNKEESDTSGLAAQLGSLTQKIRALAPSRDHGRPPRIQDTRRDDVGWLRTGYLYGKTV